MAAPSPAAEANASPRSPEARPAAFREFLDGQAGISLDDLAARAVTLQAEIVTAGRAAGEASGALFVDPGVKKAARLAEKIARKGYADAGEITDAARGGLIVDTPAQAEVAVAALAEKFDLVDEGWKTGPAGYVDRKVLVRGADGTIGEIQIIPAAMYEAKKGGGQALYTQARSLPDSAERAALNARQQDLYSAAVAKLAPDWSGIMERSSGPKSFSNVARQSASDMTPAVSKTSISSTLTQEPPGLSTANAAEAFGSNTAGRHSQLQNVTMEKNLRSMAGEDKVADADLFSAVAIASREDAGDVRFVPRDQALAEAEAIEDHAVIVSACKN